MIECVVQADKRTHGKMPTVLKTCISLLTEHFHIYHVMSSSQQPCEIQIISKQVLKIRRDVLPLDHITKATWISFHTIYSSFSKLRYTFPC